MAHDHDIHTENTRHEHQEGHKSHDSNHSTNDSYSGHDIGHGGPEAAGDFLRRFIIVTFLLIPLILLTKTALKFLGVPDFPFRTYIQFGVTTVIFYFSFVFFQHAKHEIHVGTYGMMTLVSLAVGAGYLFSVASTFFPQLHVEFYLEISSLIWVLLFGHYLEAKSSSAAGDALQEIAKLLPKQAHLIKNGKTEVLLILHNLKIVVINAMTLKNTRLEIN